MCELLGISTSVPRRFGPTMARLAARGDPALHLGDGWGVALHDGADAFIVRVPEPAARSPWVQAVESLCRPTSLAIGHIRRATQGRIILRNTQPFSRELGGRLHVFAHNGNLPSLLGRSPIPAVRFQPIGDTDSEIAFCGLLEDLTKLWSSGLPRLAARRQAISVYAAKLRAPGPANFSYTDGDALFAHADRRTQTNGDIAAPGLMMLCEPDHDDTNAAAPPSIIFASRPLTDGPWKPLPEGSLVTVQGGRCVEHDPSCQISRTHALEAVVDQWEAPARHG